MKNAKPEREMKKKGLTKAIFFPVLCLGFIFSVVWFFSLIEPHSFHLGNIYAPFSFFLSPPVTWAGLKETTEGRPGFGTLDTLRETLESKFRHVATYRFFDRGYTRLRKGDLEGAALDFQTVIEKDPDNKTAFLYLAQVKSQMGKPDEAMQILEDYSKRFGENGYVHLSLAFLYLDKDRIETAKKHFESASIMYKGDTKMENAVKANLGEIYQRMKACEKALPVFLTLKNQLPPDGLLSYKIGLCLKELHRYEEALPHFKTALITPGMTERQKNACRMELSFVFLENGFKDEAIEQLKKVMEKTEETDDMHTMAQSRLVDTYFYDVHCATDEPPVAEAYLRELIRNREAPRAARARARMELAFLLMGERRFKEAEATLERALQGSDLDVHQRTMALKNLAEVKFKYHKYSEVLKIAESLKIASSDRSFLLLMAECNVRLKRYKTAENLFTKVSSDRSTPASLRYTALAGLGNLYLKMGWLNKARGPFMSILEMTPDDTYALKSLMEIAKKRNNPERFYQYAHRVAKKERSVEFQTEVATTMAELGKHKKALRLFKERLKSERSPEARAEIYKKMGFLSLKLDDRKSAVHYFKENLNLSEKRNPQILEQLSEIYIHEGDCREAIPLLREFAHTRKGFEDHVKLARCLEDMGDNQGAAESYHAALKIQFDADVAMELALLKEKTGEIEEAIQVLTAMLRKEGLDNRTRFTIFLVLSNHYGALGNREEQRGYAEKALEIAPGDISPAEMVYPLVVTGTPSPILEEYKRAILMERNPEARAEAAVRLANLYESVNDPGKALEFLNLAIEDNQAAPLLFKRGVLLYQKGRLEEARDNFVTALEAEPLSALYLALILDEEERGGLAIDFLEDFLNRKMKIDTKDKACLLEQLAHQYYAEGQIEKSLKTVEDALTASGKGRAKSLMIKASCLNLLGRPEEAMDVGRMGALGGFSPKDNALFHQIIGDSARIMGKYPESNLHYLSYLTYHEKDASVHYSMGINFLNIGQLEKSRVSLQKAVSLDPESPSYLPDYGFLLLRLLEDESAIDVFERCLERHPYDLAVLETAAYANMRDCRNRRAQDQFEQAVEIERLRLTYGPDEGDLDQKKTDIHSLKKDVLSLEKDFSFSAYLHRMDIAGSDDSSVCRGTIPSEFGLEIGWRPPVIGFRNQRIFELTGRILGSFENESWSYDEESTQLGLGFRYKPFVPLNFFASFERLIKVGDNSENNWLLRGLASEDWGRDLYFGPRSWHSGSVYLDYGMFLENRESRFREKGRREVLYCEIKDGALFPINEKWGVVPHGIIDFHWDDTGNALGKYLEGGVGVELMGWLHETEDTASDWRVSFFVQYKWGSFKDKPPGEDGKGYHGPVIGIDIIH